MINDLVQITNRIQQEKYPKSKVIFLAGSVVRGEATASSDLDLVVVYDKLPNAYRESFIFENWPVEAFVHDPETLEFFFKKVDRPSGVPSLPSMVTEGLVIPETSAFTSDLKKMANDVLLKGPPKWGESEIKNSRYHITDLIEDLKTPRSIQEMYATGTQLYSALANFYFRSQNKWSAGGKSIPRALAKDNAEFSKQYLHSFDELFANKQIDQVLTLAAHILEDYGGYLFEGHRLEAPAISRIAK